MFKFKKKIIDEPPALHVVTTSPAAQPPEIRCYECGFLYGPLIPLIHSIMEYRAAARTKELGIDPLFAPALPGAIPAVGDVLDALGLENACCRRVYTTMRYIGEVIYVPVESPEAPSEESEEDAPSKKAPTQKKPASKKAGKKKREK
jgi:DNA-directed RNA polymerase subunit N (RpoN/RPB10)